MPFASTGSPGRIGGVHIDVIMSIRVTRSYLRTEVATENGSPANAHRQRVLLKPEVEIVISDVEPVSGASLTPLWESNHVRKTKQRLYDLQASGAVFEFFDGAELWRTPAGSRVWVIDDIEDGKAPEDAPLPGDPETWRAVIRLGEQPTFATSFTALQTAVDPELQDQLDGVVDTGQQSTTQVSADLAATLPA